jgi:glycosyltransferase involved in cell wall biosynthesis
LRILFIHQNFPGQFKNLAPELLRLGHEVTALKIGSETKGSYQGVPISFYSLAGKNSKNINPWLIDFESKLIRGTACYKFLQKLYAKKEPPDIVIGHPGWGETLFLKDLWPDVLLALYSEFFYQSDGCDVNFDPEFSADETELVALKLRMKNLNNFVHFHTADAAISPTKWQASTFPRPFREKIEVIHDGINTQIACPNPNAQLRLKTQSGSEIKLTCNDEIVTFVNRNLEPYRGFHTFMRAVPEILKQRPNVRILILGDSEKGYGASPSPSKYGQKTWREIFTSEVSPTISADDWSRVHFLGKVSYSNFLSIMQLSSVHVYLTYPFVMSWSLLEAMSAGAAVVASSTGPVLEVIEGDFNGELVNFFDQGDLAFKVCRLLKEADRRMYLSTNARQTIIESYDLHGICLPKQVDWVNRIAKSRD